MKVTGTKNVDKDKHDPNFTCLESTSLQQNPQRINSVTSACTNKITPMDSCAPQDLPQNAADFGFYLGLNEVKRLSRP